MYEIIWLNNTFHHIEPRERFAEKIDSLLESCGIVIFTKTNSLNMFFQIQFLKWRGFRTITDLKLENGKIVPHGNERRTRGNLVYKLFMNFSYKKRILMLVFKNFQIKGFFLSRKNI